MTIIYKFGKYVLSLPIVVAAIMLFCFPAFANNEAVSPVKISTGGESNTLSFGRLMDGQYTLNVEVNGQGPFVFMVDTGASRTSIFETTRKALGLDVHLAETRFVRGMTSSEVRPIAHLQHLSFVGKTVSKHDVIVLENWGDQTEQLHGILGMDVLSDLILAFDHSVSDEQGPRRAGAVRVLKKRALRARKYRRWTQIKLSENPYPVTKFGLMFTDTLVGDLRIPTLFDMGASFTAISWDIVEGTSRLRKEKKRLREEWAVHGAVGIFKPRIRINLDKIIIGNVDLKNHEILVMDFENLPINNHGKFPLVITGVDFLGGHDFILDTKTGQLILDVKPKRKRSRRMNNSLDLLPPSRLPL